MKTVKGNIWDYHQNGAWVVIPTNGVVKKNGTLVMGGGVAHQAAEKFPSLPKELGHRVTITGNMVYVFFTEQLFAFPTKGDWRERATLELIEKSLKELVELTPEDAVVFLPLVGCGLGGLDPKMIRPLLQNHLDDRFSLVTLK